MSEGGIAKVAVIGGGISGLAAAYLLSRRFRVTVLEKENRLGGHILTVPVESDAGMLHLDMGFIAHNRNNYPNLCRLLAELKVESCESDWSFALHGGPKGLTWSSRGMLGRFAQLSNTLKPSFHGLWREVARFGRLVRQLLEDGANQDIPLAEFMDEHHFGPAFREQYLYPLAGSLWSIPPGGMDAFPAFSLLFYFRDQGLLDLNSPLPWRTIPGGASRYLEPLAKPFSDGIILGAKIHEVRRNLEEVSIRMADGEILRFDHVVFACHGDQALPLLGDATKTEREVLSAFHTHRSPTVLHTDFWILGKPRRAWASRNVVTTADRNRLLATYHLNQMQALPVKQDFFVSLNADSLLDQKSFLRREVFHHPAYDLDTLHAQSRWGEISGRYSAFGRTHYCGAHWGLGSHEDGLNSAIKVAESMGINW